MYAKKPDEKEEEMTDETDDINPIDKLFGIEMENTTKNVENDNEPATTSTETVMKLPCHIDNNNNPISNIDEGLEISLKGQLEKFSEMLQRNAIFEKT